jgi:Na+-translocating ferredoxin:NAD+ oxidoreductase RnfD subunit
MARTIEPRDYQLTVLSLLLGYGVVGLGFEFEWQRAAAAVAATLLTQLACTRLFGLPRFDPKSALISGLSLSLLLRTDSVELAAWAGFVAIASKFTIRHRGKHVFNPTCLALVVLMAASDHVWVSAGQWGNAALSGFGLAGLGMLVVYRSARSDVTWAFLCCWGALLFGRALWLGDPLAIPLHALESGALLLFAFFMISDPKTTPDSRAGRILFAALVAAAAGFVQFGLYRPNALLLALAAAGPLVPLIDRLLPGERYEWSRVARPFRNPLYQENAMKRPVPGLLALLLLLAPIGDAEAFCGFYVAKADAKLYNRASQVVIARDGDRTVVTMSNDFRGDPSEFAMVIPVPTFIERRQIHVGDRAALEHLDAFTAPRLVEYFDPDPCSRALRKEMLMEDRAAMPSAAPERGAAAKALGVRIEAAYTVGEYDILILSAEQSDGLARWLRQNGYRLPDGAERILGSYLRQDMRFFVARVNLGEKQRLGTEFLRPLQVAYESPKFMLPIRLGTLNADGPQELFVYTLTRRGRVETTNYRTLRLPTGMEIPTYVKAEFGDFYKAMFDEQVRREQMRAVFLEYAWDMGWCDPCSADPLSPEELRGLGVFWLDDAPVRRRGASDVFVTRLHLRYDAERFPADLVFQQTGDRRSFQGRYVLRHAFQGNATCSAAEGYWQSVREREEREAQTLAGVTGWSLADIRSRIGLDRVRPVRGERSQRPWWERIWSD